MSAAGPPVLFAHSCFLAHDAKQVRKMRPYAPLATLLAASVVRRSGREVALFDAMLSAGEEEFEADLARVTPRVVAILEDNFNFLTKMCTQRNREACVRLIRSAKAAGARVVVNGSDASDDPAFYLDVGADAVILGETERTVLDLLDAWDRAPDADLSAIPGLALPAGAVRAAGSAPTRTPPRPFVDDLDSLPLPAWDLVDADRYRKTWSEAHGRLSWNMVTTRGCPYRCNWCAKPLYGVRYAQRSPASVAEEMRQLKEAVRPDHVWFADDIFGLSHRWIERFAEEVRELDASIPFTIQSRVDLMSETAVEALRQAGAEEVWMGVESGAQSILDAMDKGTTIAQVRGATRRLKEAGIRASWFLQLGYPGETWDEIVATRELVREERPSDVGVSVAYPLPGTVFYERVKGQLGERSHWKDSDDLDMMFEGTYAAPFYKRVRDLLHEEAALGAISPSETIGRRRRNLDAAWLAAERDEPRSRTGGAALPTRQRG
ncbi:MAG: B12-binding domain-containing radical SAM protein [Thermoanaerobaculia bacterium]|nr:B12-binding domain-containing radical SAM protein [Thermoanaerobaculia bacterium]